MKDGVGGAYDDGERIFEIMCDGMGICGKLAVAGPQPGGLILQCAVGRLVDFNLASVHVKRDGPWCIVVRGERIGLHDSLSQSLLKPTVSRPTNMILQTSPRCIVHRGDVGLRHSDDV